MSTQTQSIASTPAIRPSLTLAVAWIVTLLASLLPRIILQEIFHQTISSDLQLAISLSVIVPALLAALVWRPLRGLLPFFIFFLVIVATRWVVYNYLDEISFFRLRLQNPRFNVSMLAEQSLNLIVALVAILVLLILHKRPANFFLTLGDIAAPVKPISWLGVKDKDRWSRFGLILTACISLGTLAFLVIAGTPPLDLVVRALPFLPAVLLAATINAFYEEVTYKAAFLSVLEGPVGPRQAVYLVAAYFGIWHFYGVPYGVIGVLLATFLGWILARSMQDTRGLFWAWFIHFWQDVWIFSFMAIGAIIPGGG